MGTLLPGVTAAFEYATWTDQVASPSISANAWRAGVAIDLSQFGMTQWSPMLSVWYDNFGNSSTAPGNIVGAGGLVPLRNYACTIQFGAACWDWQGWGVDLTATFSPRLNGGIFYQSGSLKSTGATLTELWARLNYSLAARTTVSLNWFRQQTPSGTDASNFYRVQLTYSW